MNALCGGGLWSNSFRWDKGQKFWLDSEAGENHVDVVAEGCNVDCRWGLAVEVAAVSKVSWRD